jgi:uncharacterized protein
MKREATKYLYEWKDRKNRKPLVIRGARQTGKTWLVRDFGKKAYKNYVEINFDKNKAIAKLFEASDVKEIIKNLDLELEVSIEEETLLFLDEIQNYPAVFAKLRYFYEDLPDLHIIAAGSLLEFLLAEHSFSMPVGRIEYLFLGPLNFEEFLSGIGQKKLVDYLREYSFDKQISDLIHNKLLKFVKKYFVIGGMPAVVSQFVASEDYKGALREQKNLLQTYIDDFSKYKNRVDTIRLQKVFRNFPLQVGQKVKYVNIDKLDKARDLAGSIILLNLARVIYSVKHSNANGVPLGAEINESDFKALFLDVGLMQSILNLRSSDILNTENLIMINSGSLAEQFVGQHLLYNFEFYEKPELYYWNREKKNSSAEIDYLQQLDGRIIPVEVKAGKTGSLKSLHQFVSEKKINTALRIYSGAAEKTSLSTIMPGEEKRKFTLISIPFYLIGQINRLIKEVVD